MKVAVVTQKRSGSTVFREFLASGGALEVGEVFHGQARDTTSFYPYAAARIGEDPLLATPAHLPHLSIHGMNYLCATSADGDVVFGLIDSDIMLFESRHAFTTGRPLLFDYLDALGVRFVQVRRRNVLASLISLRQAEVTDIWERKNGQLTDAVVALELESLVDDLESLVWRDEVIAKWLAASSLTISIAYEDMFGRDGLFSSEAMAVGRQFFPDKVLNLRPVYTKTGHRDASRGVGNWSQVCEVLAGTRFEWMTNSP